MGLANSVEKKPKMTNQSQATCCDEGKKKPGLVCTKPGFSILKSGGCHQAVLTTAWIDEFSSRTIVVT
jgi:transketolase C-terminal domain/subunit